MRRAVRAAVLAGAYKEVEDCAVYASVRCMLVRCMRRAVYATVLATVPCAERGGESESKRERERERGREWEREGA